MRIFAFLFMSLIMTTQIVCADGFETYTEDWKDDARDRTIPVRIYVPKKLEDTKYPVMLLSHGLGGSRDGFPYLGEHWASNGYIIVVMQHPGTDSSVIKAEEGKTVRESMQKTITRKNGQDRVGDVKFVLDTLEEKNRSDEKLKKKLDLDKIGIGGHSFGSHTTIATISRAPREPEPRIKVAIAMSPNSLDNPIIKESYRSIKVPIMHLTGTKDVSVILDQSDPSTRRNPFDLIEGVDQYLIIFKDGNHMLFSGHKRPLGLSRLEKKYQPIIQEITLKFLDAYLKEDEEARKWVKGKEFENTIGENGTLERKPLPR